MSDLVKHPEDRFSHNEAICESFKFPAEQQANARSEKQREVVGDMIEKREELHYRSRSSPYPGTTLMRFPVPNEKVSWKVGFLI